jgi:hypothetical protein
MSKPKDIHKVARSTACSMSTPLRPSPRQRTIKIRDQRWRIRWVPNLGENDGCCDYDNKIIRIAKGQTRQSELDTVIHEITHAALPDVCEESVTEFATDLVAALIKLKLL